MTTTRLNPMVSMLVAAASLAGGSAPAQDWPGFRGPSGQGIADEQRLPTVWDVKTGANIRWKTAIPGLGHSTPIVSGTRLLVTAAVTDTPAQVVLGDEGGIQLADERGTHSWRVFCLDTTDGRVLWQREARAGVPPVKRHVKASHANATPATDGTHVVAVLPAGLFAFDMEGKPLWNADLGTLNPGLFGDASSEWGHASSPVIFEDLAIVQVDRHKDSYLAAYDLATGKRAWKVAREERPVWATPLLLRAGERVELVVVGGNYNRAYDPRTGRELWRFKDEAEVKTPTPFASDGLIVFSGGYRGRPMFALKPGGKGDLSLPEGASGGPFLAWRTEAGGPYTTTPLAYRGLLYGVRDEGIAFAYDMKTGARVWRGRTGATHAASPVASDGKIYLTTETGEVLVLRAGGSFEVVARNDMGEPSMATPAISARTLFIRARGHVYAVSETKTTGS